MLTLGRAAYQKEQRYAEYAGLSTDDKANNNVIVNPKNGDVFKEIDTGNIFKYNEESDQWVQQPSTGGGSQTTGVSSFNGRTGAVTPVATDYPPDLIGAVDKAGDTMSGDLNMGGNDVTGVHSVIAEGSTNSGLLFESNGTIVGVVTGGTRSATFTANSIDAYEHQITRVGEPLNDTDAARKIDIDTVANTVNEIIDGTEVLPYLPEDYIPPIATATTVGMVKPGTNFEVTADGTLNYTGSTTSGITQTEADARYLQLAGGTLTGTLNMGTNKITMGGTPTVNTDVTNKGYVDGVVKVVSDEVDGILTGTTPVAIPVANETHVGGIKPGAGTAVSGDGTLTIIVPVPTAEDEGKILVVEGGQYVLKTLTEIQG